MTEIALQITAMLARKREIERRATMTNHMESDHGWLVDAVDLLLRIELERQSYAGRKGP